ncbi:hypothetical protein CEW83_12035 [Parazoarcus communis]|uniref:Uncharacterized protein n=1 Tax=Parazoarcus communis TaxID=41977 RepID=A0A2U8GW79_9RHOO|nr:hypothetical protein CEW83_12035 [Parazoarcus communis]
MSAASSAALGTNTQCATPAQHATHKEQATSNKQQATSNKQQATSNKQQAIDQKYPSFLRCSIDASEV